MRVKVDDKPFTVEELMSLSRPEAISVLRQIEEMLEDAEDIAVSEYSRHCNCTLEYHIDSPLLNENQNCSVKESAR